MMRHYMQSIRNYSKNQSRAGRTAAILSLAVTITFSAGAVLYPAATANAAAVSQIAFEGKAVTSVEPLMYKGATFVSLRETAEQLGATVRWNPAERVTELEAQWRYDSASAGNGRFSGELLFRSSRFAVFSKERKDDGAAKNAGRSSESRPFNSFAFRGTSVNLTRDTATLISAKTKQADQYLIDQQYSGIALIAKNGQILLRKGYGYSDENRLVHADQKSRIASLTKSFTAAAVMKLAEKGKLKLDDTLESYIPGFPSGDRITIHMLLSHTSGITSNIPREQGMTLQQTVDAIKSKPLLAEPGAEFKYSNGGYVLLASIIEQVSGMKYGDYLNQQFFQPLNMDDTGEADASTQVIKGYIRQGKDWTLAGDYVSPRGRAVCIPPWTTC